ncbi:MAG: hypothetical protein KY460_13195 [Actinobacteria bacterium]|nr:hypothetical protein [Actinomycetota bacterium]
MPPVTRHLPPQPGVTEVRVHGVGGGTPQGLLRQTGVYQVSGDETAGLYRGAVDLDGERRNVEAYSWGGLTAGARNRAFWVLLLPFSMINLAGWMVEPGDGDVPSRAIRWHEWVVLWIGMVTTAMYIMWVAFVTMNIAAYQCAAIPECVADRWYLEYFQNDFFRDQVGRRVVVAGLVPLGVLALFVGLGRVSRSRYDDFGSPRDADAQIGGSALGRPEFWFTSEWQRQAARLHVAGTLAVFGGLLARATALFRGRWQDGASAPEAWWLFAIAVTIAVAALAVLAVQAVHYDRLLGRDPILGRTAQALQWSSMVVTVAAAVLAWRMQVPDASLAPVGADGIRAPVTDLWGFGWAPVLLFSLAVTLVGAFSLIQVGRWAEQPTVYVDQFLVPVLLVVIVFWPIAGWVTGGALVALVAVVGVRRMQRRAGVESGIEGAEVVAIVLALLGLLRIVGAYLPAPWGVDAGRLSPLLLCTAVLTVISARRQPRPSAAVQRYVVALTVATVAVGAWLTVWFGRWEWLHVAVGLAFLVLSMIWLARFTNGSYRGFRWNGPGAIALLALSVIAGTFAGGVIRLVDMLDLTGTVFTLPATAVYQWISLGFALALVAGLVAGLAWYGYVWFSAGPAARQRAEQRLDGLGEARGPIAREVARMQVLAEAVRGADVFLTMVAMLMLGGWIALNYELFRRRGGDVQNWIDVGTPTDWGFVVNLASWLAVGVTVGAFISIRRGLRDPEFRTQIGILWDVASFWPRTFHPFAPPTYAARAVPELQDRVAEIADVDDGHAILSGHSQGSVVCLAAAASLPASLRRRVSLVTYGSPLGRFYTTYFPRCFTERMLRETGRSLGQTTSSRDGSWLNFHRPTDPLADPVFTGQAVLGDSDPVCPPPALRAALLREHRTAQALSSLPDVRLDDPSERTIVSDRRAPVPRGHGGYPADPRMAQALIAIADHATGGPGGAG